MSVAINEAVNPVAKPNHVKGLHSYVAPQLLDSTGKPSVESDVLALSCLIKSVHALLKCKNVPVAVQNALARSASDHPPIYSIKEALYADN